VWLRGCVARRSGSVGQVQQQLCVQALRARLEAMSADAAWWWTTQQSGTLWQPQPQPQSDRYARHHHGGGHAGGGGGRGSRGRYRHDSFIDDSDQVINVEGEASVCNVCMQPRSARI
jgi:hypothetical protein